MTMQCPQYFRQPRQARYQAYTLGGSVHDPTDSMSKKFFKFLATFAEFESDLISAISHPALAFHDPTNDLNPPYVIRAASKPELDELIKSAILGSAATFLFIKSRA